MLCSWWINADIGLMFVIDGEATAVFGLQINLQLLVGMQTWFDAGDLRLNRR